MRFGLNTFLKSPGFTDSDSALISEFKSYGADAIELAVVEPSTISVPQIKYALSLCDFEGPIICGAFGSGRDLRGTPEQMRAASSYIEELIGLAVALDSKIVCGPLYSQTGRSNAYNIKERQSQRIQIVNALKPLCARAEAAGITLAVEPLNRFETDCINTLEQAVSLAREVESTALKLHIDTFHMHIEEVDSVAAILKYGEYIAHVHASASHRGIIGKDQVNWKGILRALHKIGYTGDIIIESFSKENKVIARAASIWRSLYDSPEQLAVESLQFLRKNWKQLAISE